MRSIEHGNFLDEEAASLMKENDMYLAARLRIDRLAVSVSRDYPATTVLAGCG